MKSTGKKRIEATNDCNHFTDLRYGGADYKPRPLPHKQEVVAQQDGVLLLVARQQGEKLLKGQEQKTVIAVAAAGGG